jgi:hypothetical protein
MTLRLIGYWRSEREPDWPDPHDFIDDTWDATERLVVKHYLLGGTIARAYRGLSLCRICGAHNGANLLTDGTYAWPDGLAHYVDGHDVRLPAEFVHHAISRMDEIEEAEVDQAWWSAQRGSLAP